MPDPRPLDALRAWLLAHAPADPREAEFRGAMLDLTGTADPCAREQFSPGHFTASAFVLAPERDALLLVHHAKLGIWVQPGGHFEPGDPDALAAARREVTEEVGLDVLEPLGDERPSAAGSGASAGTPLFDLDVHVIPARPAGPAARGRRSEPEHRHFDLRFAFVSRTRSLRLSDEVRDARWVALTALDTVTTDESVRRAARKLAAAAVAGPRRC